MKYGLSRNKVRALNPRTTERLLSRPAATLSSIRNGGEGQGEEVLQFIGRNMPPRRGLNFVGSGFYNDAAPTALSKVAPSPNPASGCFQAKPLDLSRFLPKHQIAAPVLSWVVKDKGIDVFR